jgi:hypothetical protein
MITAAGSDGRHHQKDVCQPDQLIKSSTMATDKLPFGTTIVGGRPMRRAVEVSDLPQGVERVLTLAALNHRFRAELLRDPVAAARSKGVVLDEVESALLGTARPEQLTAMVDRIVIPRSSDRRSFVKSVSASIVAMVTGKAVMLCSGCTGMDTWRRDAAPRGVDSGGPEVAATQRWEELNGYTTYVYIPPQIASRAHQGYSVMVALHGEDETCLASVQRWGTAAEYYDFVILAVSWTEIAATPATKSKLAIDLAGIAQAWSAKWPTAASKYLLSSRGASTPIAFQAAGVEPTSNLWASAVFLGGVPDGDWVNDPAGALALLQTKVPRTAYVLGDADPDYAQASACRDALIRHGMVTYFPTAAGSLKDAVLDFSNIYAHIRT